MAAPRIGATAAKAAPKPAPKPTAANPTSPTPQQKQKSKLDMAAIVEAIIELLTKKNESKEEEKKEQKKDKKSDWIETLTGIAQLLRGMPAKEGQQKMDIKGMCDAAKQIGQAMQKEGGPNSIMAKWGARLEKGANLVEKTFGLNKPSKEQNKTPQKTPNAEAGAGQFQKHKQEMKDTKQQQTSTLNQAKQQNQQSQQQKGPQQATAKSSMRLGNKG